MKLSPDGPASVNACVIVIVAYLPYFNQNSHWNAAIKGSLAVWALYAYFSDSQNAAFELLVWWM